jgi:type I restriction enzyme S subunit
VGDGFPFYQGKKGFTERLLDAPTSWTRVITKKAEKGDLLMSVRAPVGPVNVATESICIGRGLAAIRPGDRVDNEYLFYALKAMEKSIQGSEGAVFASINKSQIAELTIPLPSLDEQRRIVKVLDEAFEGIATAKANAEKNLRNSRALFESRLNAIITQRGAGWLDRRLGEVCSIARGGSPRPIQKYLTTDPNGINWIKISDATASGKYIYKTREKIIAEGAGRSRMVHDGDFLLSNSMSFGRPYIMRTTGCIHDGWLVLSNTAQHLDQDYLYYVLGSGFVFQQFDRLAAGSTVRNLNIELARSVEIPVPPLARQRDIARHFDILAAETHRLATLYEQKLAALEALKKSMLHQAFTGQFGAHAA